MGKVSIIVPIYNVEKYLSKCIESILSQTYKNIEIILVDDGSPDNSPQICDEYAKKDDRIIVIHKANGGVSSARNAGLDIATGKYIGFVDPDDYIMNDIGEIINILGKSNYDIAISGYNRVDEDGNILKEVKWKQCIINEYEIIKNIFDYRKGLGIRPSVWNKIFTKKSIGELKFREDLHISEDLEFLVRYLSTPKLGILIPDIYYNNVRRNSSVTNNGGKIDDISKTIDIDDELYMNIKKRYPKLKNIILAWITDDNIGWYKQAKKLALTDDEKIKVSLMKRKIMKKKYIVLLNKLIYWKTRIVFFIGKF